MRAGLFHALKVEGYSVEEVTEYAKDLVYEERGYTLTCQPYVHAKQLRNLERVYRLVDVVVTDSPTLLSAYYNNGRYPKSFDAYVVEQAMEFTSLNFMLIRSSSHQFDMTGRLQDSSRVERMHDEMTEWLNRTIPCSFVTGDEAGMSIVLDCVKLLVKPTLRSS
jgi:hypothetical protein